ncbi:type I-F CRISPR-associated endonuclease Cas1f [Fluviispira sanaruensis]|uniref:Type I-F CRISPR-associated endonuclease Cas1 n=1 Tax=Fluviispira sanaruensis TaxID=2493639 RepID=A0A4P2VMI3_FLUSA|nr:type I-F CRISPR-associated endonuclease Cas1f [Fluviispira sanaruensis]BBH52669.1 type I-F CRISPR-associated endonuclease Cas1 [Fluviispira sanaruensis]
MPILASHKEGLVYLEHAKIFVKNDMVNLAKREEAIEKHWTIPIANTCGILLGPGTSLTQQAAKKLSKNNVIVGFVGGGGVPIFYASQSEYRKTEYLQAWIRMWPYEKERLKVAKIFNNIRIENIRAQWEIFFSGEINPDKEIDIFYKRTLKSTNINELMSSEGHFADSLYKLLKIHFNEPNFKRIRKTDKKEKLLGTNSLLTNGNYYAYGLAACALWTLGIPHSMPVSHGRTRRGALVFDLADLVKDACVMPQAFISNSLGHTTGKFKSEVLENLDRANALVCMFDSIKNICELYPEKAL